MANTAASEVMLRRKVLSTRVGVEQVQDFVWGRVPLSRIPQLLNSTVYRWTGTRCEMPMSQVRRFLAIATVLADFEFLLQWHGTEGLMLAVDAGDLTAHTSCLPMTLSLGNRPYPLSASIVAGKTNQQVIQVLERGVSDFQAKYDFLRTHFKDLPEASLQDAIEVGVTDRGLSAWLADVVEAGWCDVGVPEPEHRAHLLSKKAAGQQGKDLLKLAYSFIVGNSEMHVWLAQEKGIKLGGVWVTPCGKIRFTSLSATAYSLLTPLPTKTETPTTLMQCIDEYLQTYPSVQYSDLYKRKPNQWHKLALCLGNAQMRAWASVQHQLFRVFIYAVATGCRMLSKLGFSNAKDWWHGVLVVAYRRMNDPSAVLSTFLSTETDVFGVKTGNMVRATAVKGDVTTVRFVGNDDSVDMPLPHWGPADPCSYVNAVARVVRSAVADVIPEAPAPLEDTSVGGQTFNAMLVALRDVQREVSVYASRVDRNIDSKYHTNASSTETPVRICKGAIRDSCGVRITDLCLRGMMVGRHHRAQFVPRDELWGDEFVTFAQRQFATAEGDMQRSFRLGEEELERTASRSSRMARIDERRTERETAAARVVRMSTQQMVDDCVTTAVVREQAMSRGVRVTGCKKDVFLRVLQHDKEQNCTDVCPDIVPDSFFLRGRKRKRDDEGEDETADNETADASEESGQQSSQSSGALISASEYAWLDVSSDSD